ncbi:MAG: hypothetical protein F9K31_03375 [Dokdonella sp.]|nr:MAG: hypothetical protein F9K31_03375 [Dokdonella sp.]
MRGLAFALFSVLLIATWPWLPDLLPWLLPPGIGLAQRLGIPADPGDEAQYTRFLAHARDYALVFWWVVGGVGFVLTTPEWRAWLRRLLGRAVEGASDIGAAVAGAPAVQGARDALVQPVAVAGTVAAGFAGWLRSHLSWFVGHALVSLIIALMVAGATERFLFTLIVLVLVLPLWVFLLEGSAAIMLVVAVWALLSRGLEALLRLGTVTRYDAWNQRYHDVDVKPLALAIWIVLMLGCLLRAWLDYRQSNGEPAVDSALQRARARVAARGKAPPV